MRYEYVHVSMDEVIDNPEEYIIPECMDACKIFWEKGIETFMCSNYENVIFYVSINEFTLDENNKRILDQNSGNRFFGRDAINEMPVIRAEVPEKLSELAKLFVLQDAMDFKTRDQILEEYKRRGHTDCEILPNGMLRLKFNPQRVNATIEDALKDLDLKYYDAEEGKLFGSKFAFEHHKKFKEINTKLQQ